MATPDEQQAALQRAADVIDQAAATNARLRDTWTQICQEHSRPQDTSRDTPRRPQ